MSGARVTRRDVLAGAGVVLAGGALSAARRGREGAMDSMPAGGKTVILQGDGQVVPGDVVGRFAARDAHVVQLEADPVRQWRGPQARLLAAAETRLLGVSSWPQFLLVRGLAEESGRRVRYQRLDARSGAMVWLVA